MRLLHTADWHLGQTLNNWNRDQEHALWLAALADIVEAEQIDVMLIAGDIYDGINPSGEAQRLLFTALAEFRQRRPNIQIIMTSGNHDPSGRLEAPEAILRHQGVSVVGTLDRDEDGFNLDKHLINLKDASGNVVAQVLALPFLRAHDMPGMAFTRDEDDIAPVVLACKRLFDDLMVAVRPQRLPVPLLAMAHLHAHGGSESEGAERRILLGGEHAIPADVFPREIDYVALGHLHRPQTLGNGRLRYSGSCFPLSAAEIPYRHGVTIMDIRDGSITFEHKDIERPAAFYRIPATGSCEISELDGLLADLDVDPRLPVGLRPFVHVYLKADGPASVILSEAERLLATCNVRTASLKIMRDSDDEALPAVTSLSDISTEELFSKAFLKVNSTDPEPRHLAAFREVAGSI